LKQLITKITFYKNNAFSVVNKTKEINLQLQKSILFYSELLFCAFLVLASKSRQQIIE